MCSWRSASFAFHSWRSGHLYVSLLALRQHLVSLLALRPPLRFTPGAPPASRFSPGPPPALGSPPDLLCLRSQTSIQVACTLPASDAFKRSRYGYVVPSSRSHIPVALSKPEGTFLHVCKTHELSGSLWQCSRLASRFNATCLQGSIPCAARFATVRLAHARFRLALHRGHSRPVFRDPSGSSSSPRSLLFPSAVDRQVW